MDILAKLELIDKRVIYTVVMLLVSATIVHPIGLPIVVSPSTLEFYGYLKALKTGDNVLVLANYDVGEWGEMGPTATAIMKDLFNRPVRIYVMSVMSGHGVSLTKAKIEPKLDWTKKKVGVDYVNLGYVSGGETGLASFAKDFLGVVKNDINGNPVATMPIMDGAKSAADINLCIGVGEWHYEMIRQITIPYKVTSIMACIAISAPLLSPYVPGTVKAIMPGLRGGAEFEIVSGYLGNAISGMDAISLTHMMIILLIISGNAIMLLRKRWK